MKLNKFTNSLAVSTILIGTLLPTTQAIAITGTGQEHKIANTAPTENNTTVSEDNETALQKDTGAQQSSNVILSASSSDNQTNKTGTDVSSASLSSIEEEDNSIKSSSGKIESTTKQVINSRVVSTENGINAQSLIEQGIANAAVENEKNIEEKLIQKDWSSLRVVNNRIGDWKWITAHSTSLPNDGLLQIALYGDFMLYSQYVGSSAKSTPFSVFSLDKSQLPSVDEFTKMSYEEAASYSMNDFNFGSFKSYLIDDNEPHNTGLIGIVQDGGSNGEQDSYGIVTVNESTSESALKNVVGTTINFIGGTPGVAQIKPGYSEISPIAILPDGTSYSSNAFSNHGIGHGSDSTTTTSYAATLKDKSILKFFKNQPIDISADSLVGTVLDTAGNPAKSTKGVDISWYLKPDSSVTTTNGSAIIQVDNPNGITYLRVPYEVTDDTAINVHDSTIYTNSNWIAADNFISATTADGTSLDYAGFIAQGGVVDDSKLNLTTPGIYEVAYKLNDVNSKATITVIANQTAVNVHDSTIYVGDAWSAADNFDSALDKDGNTVNFSEVKVDDSKFDTSKAGTYDVTYTYDGIVSTAKVTVKAKQTAVNVHDSTIYVGDAWSAADNFDSALDKDGNTVNFSEVKVDDSKVDTSKAGTYDVTYTYDGIVSTAKVTVKDILTVPVSSYDKTTSENIKSDEVEKNNDNQLPQTGENQNEEALTIFLGMLILIPISIVIFFKKKFKS